MNWLLEHLQILLIAAGAIAYWLNQRHSAPTGDQEERRSDDGDETRPARETQVLIPDEVKRRILEQLGIPVPRAPRPPEPVAPPPIVASVPPPMPSPGVVTQPKVTRVLQVERRSDINRRGRAIRATLRSPDQVRQAVILREVLGPPVGLR